MRSNFDWKLNDIYYFSELYSSPKHRKEIDKGYYVSWKKIFWLILGYILWTYETSLRKINNPSYTLLWFERYKDYPFLFKRLWKPFSSRMLRWNWPSDFEEDFLKNPIIFFTLSWFFFLFEGKQVFHLIHRWYFMPSLVAIFTLIVFAILTREIKVIFHLNL